ncbi:Uncharacterised protein [Bordetella pertussis]|nr:Uncharacterised protein [Bordetella pertussis]
MDSNGWDNRRWPRTCRAAAARSPPPRWRACRATATRWGRWPPAMPSTPTSTTSWPTTRGATLPTSRRWSS